jgi:hypothetical protein
MSIQESPPPGPAAHVMDVMDPSGHTTVTWDPENADSVRDAKREFDRLKREGYQAFRMDVVTENGVVVEQKGAQMDRFDPTAGRVLMVPHLRGG